MIKEFEFTKSNFNLLSLYQNFTPISLAWIKFKMTFKVFLILLFKLITAYSIDSKCFVKVNDHATNVQEFSLSEKYNVIFGSHTKDNLNEVIGYAIDMECLNSSNDTTNRHFYFKIQNVNVEVNIYNCSASKNLLLRNFDVINKNETFTFDTDMAQLPVSVNTLKMKLSMNRRYGGGCLKSITFQKSYKPSIVVVLKELWKNSKFFKAIVLLILCLILLAAFLLVIIFMRRNLTIQNKKINLSIPLVTLKRQGNKMVKTDVFGCGVDNKSLDTSQDFQEIVHVTEEKMNVKGKVDGSVQSYQFQILREQFSQTDPEKFSRNGAYLQP